MKKKLLNTIAIALLIFASCKKDSPGEPESENPFDLEYSNLDTLAHKKNLEQAGVDFVAKIESLPDEKFVKVLDYLTSLAPALEQEESSVSSILSLSNSAKRKDLKGVFNTLTTVDTATNKLSEVYATYTYNKATGEWVKSASANMLKFVFPSSDIPNASNAELSISYTASAVKANLDGDKYELPSSVTAALKVDGKDELKLTSSYEYKTDGTPTKTEVNLVLGSFTFNSKVNNSTTEASSSLSLKKGSETLMSFNADAKGDMSKATAEDGDFEVEDLVKNANATFEIMNIKLAGQVDIAAVSVATDKINYNLPDSITAKQEAEAINKNSNFVAVNKNDNTVIAKLVFAGISETSSDCWHNWQTQQLQCYTYSYTSVEPRLVFKDGTPIAFDSFFNNGFGKFFDELEELGEKF